jgi:molecular chaperone DnaK
MAATFGLDFGTTNSLAVEIAEDPKTGTVGPRVFTQAGRPHPSVVCYSGAEPIVGARAREYLYELGLGVFGDVVRSPKGFLGSPSGIHVGGVTRQAVDVVADVLRFVREDALRSRAGSNAFECAVLTVPVNMRGPARAELRQAALKAGIRTHRFVHEPLAALYGYLRGQPSFRAELAALERRQVLVFDWGGGTLDLTLCQLRDGMLMQIFNAGDDEVGGDKFDLRLRQLVLQKHAANFPHADWSRIQPSGESRLIQACEDAKIALSQRSTYRVFVEDLLAVAGPEKDLEVEVSRAELEAAVQDLISAGLKNIDKVLNSAMLQRGAIEFCLATGGMVSMPAIQQGLREMFGMNRLRTVDNAATIIAEGAAWIAYDNISLQLAKPIELLHADDSYVQVVPTGTPLPEAGKVVQHRMDVYCVDPRDGTAKFLFARPRWPGRDAHGDERKPYTHLTLPVDFHSRPLLEKLRVEVTIDHNLIATVSSSSPMRDVTCRTEIHDLEFGMSVAGLPESAT